MFAPIDTVYYDGDDEDGDYETDLVDDEYGDFIEEEDVVEEAEESLQTEIQFSPKPLSRPLRSPSGPRRMPKPSSSSPYRGLGLSVGLYAASPTSLPRDMSLDGIQDITDVFGKARRRSVDSSNISSPPSPDLLERTLTSAAISEGSQLDPAGLDDDSIYSDGSAANADEFDYSWEAQDDTNDRINVAAAVEASATLETPSPIVVPVSPLRISKKAEPSQTPTTDTGAPELGEPFDLKPADEMEVSTFEWDSDDESAGDGLRRRLSKLRQAIRNSVSLPSLKSHPRRISVGSSNASSSPESVSSLRARQSATSSSPDGTNRLWKLATDFPLDPIPGSPVSSPPDNFVPFPELLSPPTPATPISPDTVEIHSFLQNVFRDGPAVSAAVVPRPSKTPLSGMPPDLPLPPTPPLLSSPYTPPRLRERGREHPAESPPSSPNQRLTVVDPDASMVRLEMTMAKLEGYAPRVQPRLRSVSDAAAKKTQRKKPILPHMGVAINIPEDAHRGETRVSLKPSKSVQPFRLSQSSSSTSDPSSGASTSGGIFGRREHTVAPVISKRRRPVDKGKQPPRPPSLALLPMFDFEEPGHKVLDIAPVTPPRTASLGVAEARRSAGLRLHSQSVSAGLDAETSFSDSASSLPTSRSCYSTDTVDRVPQARTPPAGLRSQEEPSSFMHLTPRQPEPRSRVRRMLDRVHVRGLRGTFGPQAQPL